MMEGVTYCILSFLDGKFVFVIFIIRFALSWKLSSAFHLLLFSTYFFSFALKSAFFLILSRGLFLGNINAFQSFSRDFLDFLCYLTLPGIHEALRDGSFC